MGNPVIFAVDDDVTRLDTLARDLERRFGADYRVIAVDQPTAGLATLEELRRSGEEVAIILAGLRLPEMTGLTFLDRADDLHPHAQRGLIVDHSEYNVGGAVWRAMLLGQIEFRILTPWASPEELLYPTVTEALSAWARLHRPRYEAVTVVGQRWSPRGAELRDMLERNSVPYGFYSVDSARGRELLAQHGLDAERLPVTIVFDRTVLVDPANEEVAEALGVATHPPVEPVDVAVVGGGPAGLAAAVYGASEGLRTVIFERATLGGQAGSSSRIHNYLGFWRGVSGGELTERAYQQALMFGARFVITRHAVGLGVRGAERVVTLDDRTELVSRAVVVASGIAPRRLEVPALEALIGRGVYYGAAAAEAPALQGEEVYVVGGGNSAGQALLHLAKYAARVTLLIRGASLGSDMADYLIQQMEAAANIVVRLNTQAVDGIGERRLRGLVLEERTTGARERVPAAALYVAIGGEPHTDWLPEAVARDERGFVLTGRDLLIGPRPAPWPLDRLPLALETSVPGVFAAGDVRVGSVNRVAAAVGDGASAIRSVHQYLDERAAPDQAPTAEAATAG